MAVQTKVFTLTGSSYVDISGGYGAIRTIVPFRRNSSNGVRFKITTDVTPDFDTTDYQFVDPNNQPVGPDNIPRDIPIEFTNLSDADRVWARVNTSTNTVPLAVHRYDVSSDTTSGSYIPTITLGANMVSANLLGAHYYRMGGYVIVHASFSITMTATAPSEFDITIPIPSSFGEEGDANGVMSSDVNNEAGRVRADVANDRLSIIFEAAATGIHGVAIAASYRII
jgi:hypothetical protein